MCRVTMDHTGSIIYLCPDKNSWITSLNWSAGLTGLGIYHCCSFFFKTSSRKQYFSFIRNPEVEKMLSCLFSMLVLTRYNLSSEDASCHLN